MKHITLYLFISFFFSNTLYAKGINLCQGLVSDKKPRTMVQVPKPNVGDRFIDPQFGSTLIRITNTQGKGITKPLYSPNQAWNANESFLILYHTRDGNPAGHSLYDGKTYKYIKELRIAAPDLEQVYWHNTDPNIMYFIHNRFNRKTKAFIKYNVLTDEREPLYSFNCGSKVSSNSHSFTSWDSKMIGLICRRKGGRDIFTFNTETLVESKRVQTKYYSAPSASASGKLFFHRGNVFDSSLRKLRSLALGNLEHASLGLLPDGTDTYNEVSFDGKYIGSLVTHNMETGGVRVIIGKQNGYPYPPTGTHISAVALDNPGWVSVSSVGKKIPKKALHKEIYLANTDPNNHVVCRVAHHRSYGKAGPRGYWSEPHASISRTGTRIIFASDWGGGQTVDTYIAELPAYKK